MCLARSAHGLAPNHPIFQGPFPVDVLFEDAPTPANYRAFPEGAELPGTLPVWHVDTTDYRSDKTLQPGTVATGYGFADSPDAEVIAGGLNSKGPTAVALGRHASLLLWGFAAEPSRMTPSGQHAFLNSICYIQKFDHAPRLVQRKASGREWSLMRAAKDPAALAQAQADLEYVRGEADGRTLSVDADCKALGIGNRSTALLEHCVAAWERGEDVERTQRVLRRYTDQEFTTAAAWRAWLKASQTNLFFSDRGGYRFFVRPADVRTQLAAQTPLVTDTDPVALSLSVLEAEAKPGDVVTLAVRVTHAPGWHSYASVPSDSPYQTTHLELALPPGFRTVGHWSLPATEPLAEDPRAQTFTGDAVFLQRVRVAATPSTDAVTLRVTVSYMVCDMQRCLPPDELELQATLRVRN